jgi:hypothetical protein
MANRSFSSRGGFEPPSRRPLEGLVSEASKLQEDMHRNLQVAFAKGLEDSAYESAMVWFAQGGMGWSDLFAGTRHAERMVDSDGASMESAYVPSTRRVLRMPGWEMSVGGIKVVCDTPFVFERKDRRHDDDDDADDDGELPDPSHPQSGSDDYSEEEGEEHARKEKKARAAHNLHSNRMWVQMVLEWSLQAEDGGDGREGHRKAVADLFYMEEAAYAFALQAVLHCINACDTSLQGVQGRLAHRRVDGFDYGFFKEKAYNKEAGRVCGTFVGLHKQHMVAAFVHKRRRQQEQHMPGEKRGSTVVTMDLCKIAYECCMPGSFPFSNIVNHYPTWKENMPEDNRTSTRMPVWRCIVTPREMLDMRREYFSNRLADAGLEPGAMPVMLFPSRNVQTLHDFHFAIDLESIRVLMRFQVAALLTKRYNINADLVDPFMWYGESSSSRYSGDPARLKAAGRKMERILQGMLRKKDIVLK